MLFKLKDLSSASRMSPVMGDGPSGFFLDDVELFAVGGGGEYEATMDDIWEEEGLSSWVIWSNISEKESGWT